MRYPMKRLGSCWAAMNYCAYTLMLDESRRRTAMLGQSVDRASRKRLSVQGYSQRHGFITTWLHAFLTWRPILPRGYAGTCAEKNLPSTVDVPDSSDLRGPGPRQGSLCRPPRRVLQNPRGLVATFFHLGWTNYLAAFVSLW